MPLSKINRPGLNTGIADSSDATAITIDSSERVGLGTSTPNFSQQIVYGTSGGLAVTSNAIGADNTTALTVNAKSNTSSDYAFKAGSYNDGFRLLVRADGMVTMPKQPVSQITVSNANLTTSGNRYEGTATVNVGSGWNNSSNQYTAPITGTYYVNFSGWTNFTPGYGYMGFYKNGSNYYTWHYNHNNHTQHTIVAGTLYVPLAANDVLTFIRAGGGTGFFQGMHFNISLFG